MESRPTHFAAWLIVVLLAGIVASGFEAGLWYHSALNGPAWGPPRLVSALAWPAFYVLLALSAWTAQEYARVVATPVKLNFLLAWATSLALVVAWFWLLLGLHRPGWALAAMTLLVVALGFTAYRFPVRRGPSRLLLLPCMAWLAYVWAWNLAIWRLNGGGLDTLLG